MNGLFPFPIKKLRIILLSLLILLVLRQDSWLANLDVNFTLLKLNRYPIWRAITENELPLLSSSLTHSNNISANNITLAQEQGLLLFAEGQETKAIEIWQTARLLPVEVMTLKARYALAMDHQNIALAWYEQAIELDPLLESAWHTLGKLYTQNEQTSSAMAAYEQAIHLGDAASVDPLAKLWRDIGNHRTAIEIWQTALNTFDNSPERLIWWQGLSNSLRATEQWNLGMKAVADGLREFPENARLYLEKGAIIYGRSADADAAIEAIRIAISLDNSMAASYSTMASIMAAEKNYMSAYSWYTEAIRHNSQNPSWHVARGYMARAANDLPLALTAFLSAADHFPEFAPVYFGLANVYQQLGNKDEALTAINQALQFAHTKNVQNYLLAGKIYEWAGNFDQATDAYLQVLIIDPENNYAIQALQRITIP